MAQAILSTDSAFAIRHPKMDEDGSDEDWQTLVIGNVVDLGDGLPEESRYEIQPDGTHYHWPTRLLN